MVNKDPDAEPPFTDPYWDCPEHPGKRDGACDVCEAAELQAEWPEETR